MTFRFTEKNNIWSFCWSYGNNNAARQLAAPLPSVPQHGRNQQRSGAERGAGLVRGPELLPAREVPRHGHGGPLRRHVLPGAVRTHGPPVPLLPLRHPAPVPQRHGQAAVQLHRPHRHGDPEPAGQASHPERHLPVHHGQVPVLPGKQAGLAEQHPSQSVAERVLREDPPGRQEARQGKLLEPGPGQLQHVRQRLLPPAPETLQEEGHPGQVIQSVRGPGETGPSRGRSRGPRTYIKGRTSKFRIFRKLKQRQGQFRKGARNRARCEIVATGDHDQTGAVRTF